MSTWFRRKNKQIEEMSTWFRNKNKQIEEMSTWFRIKISKSRKWALDLEETK